MNTTMNTTTSSPSYMDYEDYTVYEEFQEAMTMWRVCSPLLLVIGTLGNIMSIVVLTRKSMRQSTISIYLTVLAVTDILVLYTGLVRHWLNFIMEINIRSLHPIVCKVHVWMVYSSTDFSCWLLVAVTMERFVSVWFPHTVKQMCTRWTAVIIIAAVGILLLVINSHFLYGMGSVSVTSDNDTYIIPCGSLWYEYDRFSLNIWPWIDLCLFCLFPFLLLITGNVAIIVKVCVSNRKRRQNDANLGLSNTQSVTVRSSKTSSMTVMLLTTNVVFLVCTSPMSIFLIRETYWLDLQDSSPREQAEHQRTWALVNVIMYTNNAINFLLYCLSGSRFRETLKCLFNRNRRIYPSGSVTRNPKSTLNPSVSRVAPASQLTARKKQNTLSVVGQDPITDQTEA